MHLWTLILPCCSPENLWSHHVPEQAAPYKAGVSCTTHPLLLGHGARGNVLQQRSGDSSPCLCRQRCCGGHHITAGANKSLHSIWMLLPPCSPSVSDSKNGVMMPCRYSQSRPNLPPSPLLKVRSGAAPLHLHSKAAWPGTVSRLHVPCPGALPNEQGWVLPLLSHLDITFNHHHCSTSPCKCCTFR